MCALTKHSDKVQHRAFAHVEKATVEIRWKTTR